MPDPSSPAAATAERARLAVLSLLLALAAVVGLVIARAASSTPSAVLLALFLLLPLLLPLPGLWRRERRTFAWATLCLTPHFIYALMEAVANPKALPLAAAMLLLATASMVALVGYLRASRG
ncbi:MAG TPA: DUF2069 domain-containing protein [Steroidobacteraceae bacterium]